MKQECDIKNIIGLLSDLQSQLEAIPRLSELDAKPSERPIEEKRRSWWARLWVSERGKKVGQGKNHESHSGGSQGGSKIGEDEAAADLEILKLQKEKEAVDLEILKLQNDIRQMKDAFENLKQFETNMSTSLELGLPSEKKLKAILQKTDSTKPRSQNLNEIRKKIFNLKYMIPSLPYKESSRGLSITDSQTAEEIEETGRDIFLPGLHVSEDIKDSPAFEQVLKKFQDLGEITKKLCLLSFAAFPENKEVKRTMLMYWWIGEGFIVGYEDSEKSVTEILDALLKNGLLEAVEDERKLNPTSYKMEPHVHSAVIYLARSVGLFDLYTVEGKLTMQKSNKEMVCLVKESSLQQRRKTSVMEPKNLISVFNSSERFPDFTFKWFRGMESLRVLYLGRWERTATRHIEVESTDFLKQMKQLKNLRLASFQGISRIEKLQESICALPKLVILDLRACYNLEVLPDDIGSLDNLIFLDVSECYMLDRMPKGIQDLTKLQVLKGFVISESDDESNCALKKLENLRKLSITVNKYDFRVTNLMESLKGLQKLESLKIAWGFLGGKKIEHHDEAKGNEETTNEEKQKKGEDDQVHQTSEEKKEDGRNEKANNLEQGEKHDEVKTESFKSEKTASASREETWTIQNKPDDQKGKSKVEGDGDKGNANLEQGKEQDEVEAEKSKSDNGVEGVADKASPSREPAEMNQKNPDDKSKVEKEENGDKRKADLEEGKKQDEVEAEKSKSDNGVEEIKKEGPSREAAETIQNNPDHHQRGDKQEEERGGEKEKVNLEEGKKRDELKAESPKPDKVIKKDEKTSPPQESKDTIQSKPDDHKTNSQVQKEGDGEKIKAAIKKLDGGEAKTQKSDKNKLGKKVSFSDDLKKDNAMEKEIHETASASRPKNTAPKESGSSKAKPSWLKRNESKKLGKIGQEDSTTDKLPSSLKKLELECFPGKKPPKWLNPKNLVNLEKLSIKGGNLSRITDDLTNAEKYCRIRILRLKYLHEFKAEWKDLHALFPQLELLEKYQCPKVTFCPTDGKGVWRSPDST